MDNEDHSSLDSNPVAVEQAVEPVGPSAAEADTSEPLLKKDNGSADSGRVNVTAIVYDPDDGLDFESSMAKAMIPMVLIFLASGWLCFTLMDDMNALDGLYMTFVTITTVGYGDFSPQGDGTKIFFIFWIFFGLSVVATGLAMLVDGHQAVSSAEEKDVGSYRKMMNAIDEAIGAGLRKLLMEIFLLVLFVAGGAVWVCTVEEYSFVDGIYWAVQTLTTVGYGDKDINHDATKVFVIVYALFGTALTVTSLATMACLWVEYDQARKVQEMIDHGLTLKMLKVIDVQKTGYIDKFEFLRYMLWKLDKVDGETMDSIIGMFDQLDADGGGTLGPEDFLHQPDAESTEKHA